MREEIRPKGNQTISTGTTTIDPPHSVTTIAANLDCVNSKKEGPKEPVEAAAFGPEEEASFCGEIRLAWFERPRNSEKRLDSNSLWE